LVCEAERAIVQRRFLEALSVSTLVLRRQIDPRWQHSLWNPKQEKVRFLLHDADCDVSLLVHCSNSDGVSKIYVGIHALGTVEISCRDRATAVAVQSYYEIMESCNASSSEDEELKGHEKVEIHTMYDTIIPLIVNAYRWENDTHQEPQQLSRQQNATMPLELLIMLLQFCTSFTTKYAEAESIVEMSAVGCADLLLSFSLHRSRYGKEFQPEQIDDIFILFYTKIIPYLDPITVRWLFETRLMINSNNKFALTNYDRKLIWSKDQGTYASSIQMAIDCINRSMQTTEWYPFSKCLNYCIKMLRVLLPLAEDQNPPSVPCINVDMKETCCYESKNDLKAHQQPSRITCLLIPSQNFLQTYVVEPLWISERRWENRFSVVSVALAAVTCWKKRKHVTKAASVAVMTVTAPIREIIEAVFTTAND